MNNEEIRMKIMGRQRCEGEHRRSKKDRLAAWLAQNQEAKELQETMKEDDEPKVAGEAQAGADAYRGRDSYAEAVEICRANFQIFTQKKIHIFLVQFKTTIFLLARNVL